MSVDFQKVTKSPELYEKYRFILKGRIIVTKTHKERNPSNFLLIEPQWIPSRPIRLPWDILVETLCKFHQ